jgi:hypothetical protein
VTRTTALAFSILAGTTTATADPIRVLKAKVAEPVLEELMGGCSMRCAFPWTVAVLDGKGGKATKVLNDEKAETAWIAADAKSGVGAKFRLSFPKKLPAEMEGAVPFYGLDLINGAWKSEELWRQHARVKKARLLYNDRPFAEVAFADSRRWQRIHFADIMVHSGDTITFEVLEIYPGEGAPLAISEIVLQGAH